MSGRGEGGVGSVGGQVGGRAGGGGQVDVNAMLGDRGYVGYRGCEPRIEGIVQCTKRSGLPHSRGNKIP